MLLLAGVLETVRSEPSRSTVVAFATPTPNERRPTVAELPTVLVYDPEPVPRTRTSPAAVAMETIWS